MMKRVLLMTFAVTLLFAFACKQRTRVVNKISPPEQPRTTTKINIEIKVDASGNCIISDPVPPDVKLSKSKKEGVLWCLMYDCRASAVRVVIDDFHDSKKDLRNPFGDHSSLYNAFDFGPFYPGYSDCTKTTVIPTGENGYYKYRINVIGPDGKLVAKEKDPGVIITD